MNHETARESKTERSGARISRLPFSEIPHQSRLFVTYQNDPLSLRKYYPNAAQSPLETPAYAPIALDAWIADHKAVCDALFEINTTIGAGKETFRNLEILRGGDAVAIVTGQQAGLFCGPLYTIFKALSAVKLAEEMNGKGSKAVAVFWAATEDHDFGEVSEAFYIDKTGRLAKARYESTDRIENSPVGGTVIGPEIAELVDGMFDNFPPTPFSGEMRTLAKKTWKQDAEYGTAFLATLEAILCKHGVIFVDPTHAGLKKIAAPLFSTAIERSDEIALALVSRGKELVSAGFHEQVLVGQDYFPLFWHDDDGRRLALRKAGDGIYKTKDGGRGFTIREALQIAEAEPERFSPGVMLRPVVQDYLFPTACYFGGGAEIAYFAQNSEVYRVLDRPVTPVFHRQSFTVVEAKSRRILSKFGFGLSDLFAGQEQVKLNLAADIIARETAGLFAQVEERINMELNRLDQAILSIDTTISPNLAKRRHKIIYHIAALRRKTLLAKIRNDEIADRRIGELFDTLLPNGGLQERTLNVFTFLDRYGLAFIDRIYDAIDLDDKDHRIIEI